jgi:membrane-associated phospholipid phosphatase
VGVKVWLLVVVGGLAVSALTYWLLTEDADPWTEDPPRLATRLEAWRQIERQKKDE